MNVNHLEVGFLGGGVHLSLCISHHSLSYHHHGPFPAFSFSHPLRYLSFPCPPYFFLFCSAFSSLAFLSTTLFPHASYSFVLSWSSLPWPPSWTLLLPFSSHLLPRPVIIKGHLKSKEVCADEWGIFGSVKGKWYGQSGEILRARVKRKKRRRRGGVAGSDSQALLGSKNHTAPSP